MTKNPENGSRKRASGRLWPLVERLNNHEAQQGELGYLLDLPLFLFCHPLSRVSTDSLGKKPEDKKSVNVSSKAQSSANGGVWGFWGSKTKILNTECTQQ